ncbi:hypothetical protein H1Q63_36560 [Desmonostoc muscorum CCALA 125]|nr:hypothetical protein [Desmonostoc muscorum CCALA 125]
MGSGEKPLFKEKYLHPYIYILSPQASFIFTIFLLQITLLGAYSCTPLQPIHLLQIFLKTLLTNCR